MTQTLEELIDQQINLGHKNPHDFYDLLTRAAGDNLPDLVQPYVADFVTEMARQRLNTKRRTQVAKITSKALENPEIMLHSLWVPSGDNTPTGIVYKRIGDMTADDFDARADYLVRMGAAILRHAQWCRDCANQIRTEKVKTFGKVKNIPQLPIIEAPEVPELAS